MVTFHYNFKITLFSLVCLISFINLGFWQLDRKEEKIALLENDLNFRSQIGSRPEFIDQNRVLSGTPLILRGTFDERVTLLLDNRIHKGVVGFEVHQLFRDESALNFIINRGFVPRGRTRSSVLDIPLMDNEVVSIRGHIYKVAKNPYLLKTEKVNYEFPQIVQSIDTNLLSNELQLGLFPFVVRLQDDQLGALPRSWVVSNMTPEKHQGYALQWFLMAFAVFVAWSFFTFRKTNG